MNQILHWLCVWGIASVIATALFCALAHRLKGGRG